MTKGKTAAIILAAGKGTRMKSDLPKVLHPLAGQPMVRHVLGAVAPLEPKPAVVIVGPKMEAVAEAVSPYPTAVQKKQAGTADAVKAAQKALKGFEDGTVLVLYGGDPFVRTETLKQMVRAREAGTAVVVLGFRAADPSGYGRLVVDGAGVLQAIVEDKDASDNERAIDLCNGGAMAIDAARLFDLVDRVGDDNAKREFYLTDVVALARAGGLACAVVEADQRETLGVDSRADLARAEAEWQRARRLRAMEEEGASLADPNTVWFSHDTTLGRDVVVGPNVVFGPGVSVAEGVEIKAFCHLEGASVGKGAVVGPFARLRPGTEIGSGAHIGNFVEVKNAIMGEGAKANHLTYLGDSEIGAGANIGAGTITCNYDGFEKHRTVIGKGAFIGSNTALVAPVKIGDGAIVGAGSTIARDVAKDALAIERAVQVDLPGRARKIRAEGEARKKGKKAGKKGKASRKGKKS